MNGLRMKNVIFAHLCLFTCLRKKYVSTRSDIYIKNDPWQILIKNVIYYPTNLLENCGKYFFVT